MLCKRVISEIRINIEQAKQQVIIPYLHQQTSLLFLYDLYHQWKQCGQQENMYTHLKNDRDRIFEWFKQGFLPY